eukprot:TRINITY_DN2194_c0_g4_i1.p1 TRINITY_DN2194_c0_g4~~TRINITY_DN2194_c0_g4_i1.p1  ORF type:complete len:271 (+),score=39.94 TRINITY_DN2194_c0_g4_i1:182-994(+)
MNKNEEVIYKEQITDFLLLILRITENESRNSTDFNEAFRKRLKFQKQTDWKRFRASIDLLDDTEYGIISAFTFQLGDLENDNNDFGGINIRLYGILNAVYLQMNAFEEISALLNYSSRSEIREIFLKLDIYKLRGIAGAHTVDYLYDKETLAKNPKINKTTSFRIVQTYLEKTGKQIAVLDENDIWSEYNLIKILTEYEKIATELLIKIIRFGIKKLILKKEQRIETEQRLNELIPKLIDYTTLDKNKDYWKRESKKMEKQLKKYNRKKK